VQAFEVLHPRSIPLQRLPACAVSTEDGFSEP